MSLVHLLFADVRASEPDPASTDTSASDAIERPRRCPGIATAKKTRLVRSEALCRQDRASEDFRKTMFLLRQDLRSVVTGAEHSRQTMSTQKQLSQIKPEHDRLTFEFGSESVTSSPIGQPVLRVRHSGKETSRLKHQLKFNTASIFRLNLTLGRSSNHHIAGFRTSSLKPVRSPVVCGIHHHGEPSHFIGGQGGTQKISTVRPAPDQLQLVASPPLLLALNHIGSLTPPCFCKKALLCLPRTRTKRSKLLCHMHEKDNPMPLQ